MNFIVYNMAGKVERNFIGPLRHSLMQAKDGEFVMEGEANDVTQKIKNPGIAGVVVDKTPEEIKAEKPPEIPLEKQTAHITNEQWQEVRNRLNNLEKSI